MAEHNEVGKIGEDIAVAFLVKHGFSVVERNYRTKYGEIDIIAEKDNVLRFVEVKSVKVTGFSEIPHLKIQPEDNLTKAKWDNIVISAETYLNHKRKGGKGTVWNIDLACVYIDLEKREGKVKFLENIHKE